MTPIDRGRLRDALGEIVDGAAVKRARHDLVFEGTNLTALFVEVLRERGYGETTVDDVKVRPGERVPAFLIRDGRAFFGWVFWEQFTSWKLRKLWGSVVKNRRGDWDLQIPAGNDSSIYANPALLLEMDIDHPPAF